MTNLKNKTLFVSGASRGIGLAIAKRAAHDGANIILAAKTAEPHPKLPGTRREVPGRAAPRPVPGTRIVAWCGRPAFGRCSVKVSPPRQGKLKTCCLATGGANATRWAWLSGGTSGRPVAPPR